MKKLLSLLLVLSIILSPSLFFDGEVFAEGDYAWVLVDRKDYPRKEGVVNNYTIDFQGNRVDYHHTFDGYYGFVDLRAIYTWEDPPEIVKPNEDVNVFIKQDLINDKVGGYNVFFAPSLDLDSADVELNYATSGRVGGEIVFADGTVEEKTRFAGPGLNGYPQAQDSYEAYLRLQFREGRSEGEKLGLTVSISTGNADNNVGSKYIYEWKKVKDTAEVKPKPSPTTSDGAEAFDSGARVMWPSSSNVLGYRLFRSTNQNQLGISVTDFYITSTSYADVNVEPNTTYYYSVKPVLAEARPFEGIDEVLGDTIATFVVTTGGEIYKPGIFKHFILLKLDDPMMSVDGIESEVDEGRGTTPILVNGRTMVPIRAIVEAMGGEILWDASSQKITIKARGNTVEMWINKKDIKVNGKSQGMDIAPIVRNGRTFLPIRFVGENLKCKVDWINSTKEIVIVYED